MEHGLGTCDQKHPPEFIEEQTVGEALCMVIEVMLQCQESRVALPQSVIVSHRTEFTNSLDGGNRVLVIGF